jgi:hypothetical protein
VLADRELTVGRADENDIVIRDGSASRRHARITPEDDHYLWTDQPNVTQPTLINGKSGSGAQRLHDGDVIEVGESILEFQEGLPLPARAAPPPGTTPPTQIQERVRTLVLIIAGKEYPMSPGTKLDPEALGAAGAARVLGAARGGAPFAEVTTNPSDAAILGLRNLSGAPWNVTLPTGQTVAIPEGRSVRLDDGVRIDFGGVEGRVQA